ncbi:MAG: glycosyltransferase family 39 protein [Clostridia bacterium]|nr:glycosyltransferase family 39 protein [Deltaproteobacteria bacterium]
MIAALVGYGYFASDDYRYALEPAWNLVVHGTSSPASGIRSVVFARIVAVGMQVAQWLGAEDPAWLVRGAYILLGLLSLTAIPGIHRLTCDRLGEPAACAASWLLACEALMPRIATRALIEVAAIPPLVWGLVFTLRAIDRRSVRAGVAAGLLLGMAGMLRFQTGIIAVCAVAYVLYARQIRVAFAMAGAGLAALLTQGLIDLETHGRFLASLRGYVAFNAERSSSFGEAPWFTYLVLLVLVTIPPLTLWLVRPIWDAARAHALVSISLMVFVVLHSFVPHKEERFLFSAFPLAFVLIGAALAHVRRSVRTAFWLLNGLALAVATLSDGQHSIIDPLRDARTERIVLIGGFEAPAIYARGIPIDRFLTPEDMRLMPLGSRLITYADRAPMELPDTLRCGPPQLYRGDFVDRALLLINPKGNRRRSAKVAIDCVPR